MEGVDHLRQLAFEGPDASRGTYTTQRTDLHLLGIDKVQHVVVRMHESHHTALNDSTAWGTALHVVSRLGATFDSELVRLLDAARHTHESFATFASVSVALAKHAEAADVLATYPSYVSLYRSTTRLLRPVTGEHRRYLMATALARSAMQTPVIGALVDNLPDLRLDPPRSVDTPDGRWRRLLRAGPQLVERAAAGADDVLRDRGEFAALDADRTGGADRAADDEWDEAWAAWELAAYTEVASALEGMGASVLTYDGHQAGTRALVEQALLLHPELGLRADAMDGAPDDRSLAAATIAGVRLHHAPQPWGARLFPVTPSDVVDHRSGHVIGDGPPLVLDARLSTRLHRLFRWPADEGALMLREHRARVDVRLIGDDDGEDVVLHSPIADPAALDRIVELWGARGPVVSIIAVSCLADREWSRTWWDPLTDTTQVVMLVDVAVDHFVGTWVDSSTAVRAAHIAIADRATDAVHGLVLAPEGSSVRWLYLGDEVSTSLMRYQLGTTTGIDVVDDPDLPVREGERMRVAITHLLATESFTDLEGLEGYL